MGLCWSEGLARTRLFHPWGREPEGGQPAEVQRYWDAVQYWDAEVLGCSTEVLGCMYGSHLRKTLLKGLPGGGGGRVFSAGGVNPPAVAGKKD